MDGTLYKFGKGKEQTFTSSKFYRDLRNSIYEFLMDRQGIDEEAVVDEYQSIKDNYNGAVSLGIEKEYGIDRFEFFANTWGKLEPSNYLNGEEDLPNLLSGLKGRTALLTAAPRIWALRVLSHLKLEDAFGNAVYTGEPDLRKPNPLIFQKIADDLKVEPTWIFSIGDQEESDILPAKAIGMRTVQIGQGKTIADYQASDVIAAIELLKKEKFI